MFQKERLPARHALADQPLVMPVNSILCLPRYVTDRSDLPIFNLYAVVARVFENYGWERATRIINPHIWAPGWSRDQVASFAASPPPGYEPLPIDSERVSIWHLFPGTQLSDDPSGSVHPQFPIVHFTGRLADLGDGKRSLDLGQQDGGTLDHWGLLTATSTARTRLLIIQVLDPADFAPATSMGRGLVQAGGPVVLVLHGDDVQEISDGVTNIYFNLSHSRPIPEMIQDAWPSIQEVEAHLIYGEGGEDLLQFHSYLQTIRHWYERLQTQADSQDTSLDDLEERITRFLHTKQHQPFWSAMTEARSLLAETRTELEATGQRLDHAEHLVWYHEGDGVVPLSESSESIERAQEVMAPLGDQIVDLQTQLERALLQAPRVLNANFADSPSGRVLGLRDGLVAERDYCLLVDVGPRWSEIPSAVVGEAQFPEKALPPDKDGYLVDLLLVSDEFSPQLTSAQMWVPRGSGRSFPIVDGERAEESGPVCLPLTTPCLPEGSQGQALLARARLCLYYQNNLLQSAAVTAGVVPAAGVLLDLPNRVEVDYVLTGGFDDVDTTFARREIKLEPQTETPSVPVSLNLAMNDNGAGGHRIIVKGRHEQTSAVPHASPHLCPPHGWTPYDPIAGSGLLENARQTLLNCFFRKHEQAGDRFGKVVQDRKGNPVFGLESDNRKSLVQFKIDLLLLADLGYDLWATAFDQVKIDDDRCIPAEWRRHLRSILAKSALIQISHTGPAQYVFPWTMVYEYPLNRAERAQWRFCKVVDDEWSPTGVRLGAELERGVCAYHQENWHRKNIICPYGFWGLKHIIEEPPSLPFGDGASLENAAREILVGAEIDIATAITEDASLDTARIGRHIEDLEKMPGIRISLARPNQDWEGLQPLLRAPELVYLLCHGEYDELAKEPYLSIGPRGADLTRRIYPKGTLASWIDDQVDGPDITLWKRHRPLVFINGCHTADLKPGQIASFATTFAAVGAAGVLGTEVSVTLPVAMEVAESLFDKLSTRPGLTLGEALRHIRWELANKGNLLGLAYTLYGLADLHLKRDGA